MALPILAGLIVSFLSSDVAARSQTDLWARRRHPGKGVACLPGWDAGASGRPVGAIEQGVVEEGPSNGNSNNSDRDDSAGQSGWMSPSRASSTAAGYGVAALPAILVGLITLVVTITATPLITTTGGNGSESAEICALSSTWQALFRSKNGPAIRSIQDAFSCCGLRKPVDMAWPFPSGRDGISAKTCQTSFGRNEGCLDAWARADRVVRIGWMAQAVGVGLWCLAVFVVRTRSSRNGHDHHEVSSEPAVLDGGADSDRPGGDRRDGARVIEYRDGPDRDVSSTRNDDGLYRDDETDAGGGDQVHDPEHDQPNLLDWDDSTTPSLPNQTSQTNHQRQPDLV